MGEGSKSPEVARPPIAALFLVVFDRKVGYSIAWKRAIPGLELDGVVEYKSLPSGLHNCQSDLVYFVHEQYAGISAFVNQPAEEADRNAHFATVGALMPLTYGRLGRSWLHAHQLRHLTESVIGNLENTDTLQEYWEQNCMTDSDVQLLKSGGSIPISTSPEQSENTGRKRRALSDAAGLSPNNPTLSKDHPAMSLVHDLDVFGPLLFPLQRAALLKKRILIMTPAPVRAACDFVYNLSVLSNIPPSATDVAQRPDSLHPIRPLFNVGVHDIAYLSQSSDARGSSSSWIACSTDDILATKSNLYDVLVELPSHDSKANETKRWPRIRTSNGEAVKATQRDLRRYYTLKRELDRIRHRSQAYHDEEDEQAFDQDESETTPLTSSKQDDVDDQDQYVQLEGETDVAEPSSWACIAYSSFLWWASAGEKDALLEDEACQDARLLDDLPLPGQGERGSKSGVKRSSVNGQSDSFDECRQSLAMLLIAYAHRLTASMMETVAEIMEAAEIEGGNHSDEHWVTIHSEDLRRMGLDEWSQPDGDFVKEMALLYFGRERVQTVGRTVDLCGIKIC